MSITPLPLHLIYPPLLLLLPQIFSQQISFTSHLTQKEEQCFLQKVSKESLVIYLVNSLSLSSASSLSFIVSGPDKKILHEEKTNKLNYAFNSYRSGDYEICMINLLEKNVSFEFTMQYGLGAKDYRSLIRSNDVAPINQAIQDLSDLGASMTEYINDKKVFDDELVDGTLSLISSNVVWYSGVVIVLMIIVGFIATAYLQDFMHKRKVI